MNMKKKQLALHGIPIHLALSPQLLLWHLSEVVTFSSYSASQGAPTPGGRQCSYSEGKESQASSPGTCINFFECFSEAFPLQKSGLK